MKRTCLTVIAGLLAATACLYVYRLEVPETRTWTADGVTALDLATRNGNVTATAVAVESIAATLTRVCYGKNRKDAETYLDEITITDTVESGRLKVAAEMPQGPRNYGCSFDFTCPDTLALDIYTSNGAVTVTGLARGMDIRTSNGRIELSGTTGAAVLNTSNGAVTLRVHSGPTRVGTSNGAVDCDIAALDSAEDVEIETSNGKVTLLLPRDVSCAFDLSTSSGDVTVVPENFGPVAYTLSERTHKKGTIGSGASTVTVETSNGDITVRAR